MYSVFIKNLIFYIIKLIETKKYNKDDTQITMRLILCPDLGS